MVCLGFHFVFFGLQLLAVFVRKLFKTAYDSLVCKRLHGLLLLQAIFHRLCLLFEKFPLAQRRLKRVRGHQRSLPHRKKLLT